MVSLILFLEIHLPTELKEIFTRLKQLLYFSVPHPPIYLEGWENKQETTQQLDLLDACEYGTSRCLTGLNHRGVKTV